MLNCNAKKYWPEKHTYITGIIIDSFDQGELSTFVDYEQKVWSLSYRGVDDWDVFFLNTMQLTHRVPQFTVTGMIW